MKSQIGQVIASCEWLGIPTPKAEMESQITLLEGVIARLEESKQEAADAVQRALGS